MKPISRDKTFEKNFKRRLATPKLRKQFEERLGLFMNGYKGVPLFDHALTGNMKGLRSFSVTGDIRVIYVETDDAIIFLDVGSHNQVYN